MSKFKKYTSEQCDMLDLIVAEDGIFLVRAGAGAGKSFMSREVVEELQPNTCLYTAFNKAIVEEGVPRFAGFNVECKTLHALAYRYCKPHAGIKELSYRCIEEDIPYKAKRRIIDAINDFFVSASTDMYEFLGNVFSEEEDTAYRNIAATYIEKMANKEIPPTFNFMLKYFHLCLHEGTVECNYDLVILDEINDTTAVALEIFKLIKAPKKIGLGESHQAIYDFLNLVDGFELLKDEAEYLQLSQSFRCSTEIAKKISNLMQKEVDKDFKFIGTNEPVKNGKLLYVTRTNAAIIKEIQRCVATKQGFTLLRKISEIFAYPMAIIIAGSGKELYAWQTKFKFLEDEYKAFVSGGKDKGYFHSTPSANSWLNYLKETIQDQETDSAVALLSSLNRNNVNLFDLYKKAKEAKKDPNYVIATVFTSKGLEFETVWIDDDLNRTIEKIRENGGIKNHDDLVAYRCYYVAASRCGYLLKNATAFH